MNQLIIYFLLVYFVLFFGVAVIWRNYAVAKSTGINAFKLNKKTGPESITGLYFKFLPLLSVLVFIIYAWLPNSYALLGPIKLLTNNFVQYAGMGVMTIALVWVVAAQAQMGVSWRIGIDHDQKTEFVQRGLFKYSRNPIFVGVIVISLGYFLLLPNPITFTILALDVALIQIQVALEENFLTEQHGKQYIDYCQQVRRWL
ncbi:MAG: isoprenylcysteine carboxylmethyltransferase family protein [Candidatus Thiodiazotropha taylori]|jgi:protein-S-isoprenylcysteine O-methyltransferase Ste14|uniref:Isoprenylcysteine carboxylmethyltransferase family protein n=1 Tax=Candidatus Thiodiazotropha taylori TaxID=2792791 RepID=A0A9E4N591_9GAMM|nr:isoprenylcysteine carboxylmethyltransferase family protein [Aestuariicella albida]MBU3069206.1 isoprenylcysteine carboxylmethyltransferase family protein [Aestuariicella albida]MCG7947333.1 isoprenylcysteine carboxylmethyltransferase family protein [Candidatus Thiodiazotropha taylori]MCW4257454.1 isoprenylcysteine carboxylmethyltransferase family protein [Candidatus Thiodiazotropha taylori]